MADLLSYGEEDISRLFPKCRLPTSASCGDVSASQRDLIDFSDASAASPRRPTTAAGTANLGASPGGAACRDRDRADARRTWMATSASMDQIRRVGSCEPPGDDSDSSSGRVPAPRDSRIELAGGRELYSQSRSRPGKRRPPAGSRGRPPPEAAAKTAPRPAETPDSLHLAILGFQPLRETSLIGEGPGGGGDAFGVGDTPVVDGPVAFDCATARVPPPVVENGRVVVEDANNGKVSRSGETNPVTVTFDTAALVGETGDQASRPNRRVIGSLPIAEYEGSPRRYGPKPPKPGPGLPQRVWHQSAADAVCQPPREYSGDREKGNGGWVDSGAEEGVNVAPVAMAELRGHYFRPSEVRGLASEATPDTFDHSGTVSAAPGSCDRTPAEVSAVVDVTSRTSSSTLVTVAVPAPLPEPSAASPPPDLAVGCEAAATAAAGAGCDADADASRNFTLSPETTECDSGEVESELSDGGSLPSSGGRLCAATMPVLEDGLSDGAASDDERPPPPPPDPTAELIRHHLSQLEAASAHCRPPGEPQPAVPVSQSLLPSSEPLYVPPSLYQPPTQSMMLSQSLLQRPGPPVLSAGPESYPTGLACARQREMGDYLNQQQQGQPPASSRYGNGDIDLRTLDPLGTVRSSPPPPAPGSGAGSPAPSTGRQAARRSAPPVSPGHQPPEDVQAAIQDIRQTLRRTRALPVRSPPSPSDLERPDRPVWIPRRSGYQKLSTQCDDPASGPRPENEEGVDTDQETDRLLGQQRSPAGPAADDGRTSLDKSWCQSRPRIPKSLTTGDLTPCSPSGPDGRLKERDAIKKKGRSKEVMVHEPAVLIEGVLFRARYLGSTQLVCEGQPTKATRMMQAEEAVSRIKVPDGETQPSTDVDLFISTEKIMVLNTDLKEIMMDHALRTISYIADIGELVVLMARRRVTSEIAADLHSLPKMICHVFESDEAQFIAQSIGQAFQVAYMEFLKANGIEDHSFVKEMDYQEVLNSQEIFGEELKMFAKKELQKEVVVPKQKGEILGVVIVESGWGSLVPTVVIANLAPSGAAARCGLLNIGDQIIAINGISLVGLPLAACQAYVKNAKPATVVKLTVVPCPPVVEVKIRRPDTKYQLGFSVQNGVICSLLRGGIAERGGVRVGHRIIEINSQSVVAVPHDRIVSLLATSVGEIHMKTMPTSLFRLLTGQESPVYI